MINFSYFNPTRLVFGKGVEAQTGEYVSEFGKNILMVYGGGSIKKNGVYDKVVASLKEHGIRFTEYAGAMPNPRLSFVKGGIELAKKENVDMVLAVGGGSAIDAAKGIAMGVKYDGDIWEVFANDSIKIKEALPVGVVLTIPAAGSESSTAMVITKDEGSIKRGYNSEKIIPRFAIVNPETNFTLPPYQTACGCTDIFAHLVERYFTNVDHVDLTDRMIEAVMRTVLVNAKIVMREPENYDARAEINFAGTVAHNNLLSCGRIGDWGSHFVQQELSGLYDVTHGAGLAVIIPAWMRYVYKHDMKRFSQFARRVMDVDYAFGDEEECILEAIRRLEDFFASLGMPTRMGHLGITDERFREMAEKAVMYKPTIGNFVKLAAEDVYNIYMLAM